MKESWEHAPPPDLELLASTEKYLSELLTRLHEGRVLAAECLEASQERNEQHYNKSAKEKSFEVGDLVVVLLPSSTNKLLSRWSGPATIVGQRSDHSYTVALDNGSVRVLHTNHLKHFHLRAEAVGVMFEDELRVW